MNHAESPSLPNHANPAPPDVPALRAGNLHAGSLFTGQSAAWAICLLVFFVHAAWPVPDVNESHYLVKAQQYWGLFHASGDVFLESRDAHPVFFSLWGWVYLFLDAETATWLGRLIVWALLAWGWCRLARALGLTALGTGLAAALFVAATAWANLSQEWVVGGLEAKGPAYALVLWAYGAALRRSWNAAWGLLGAATALHPLVGGWNLLLLAAAVPLWRRQWRHKLPPLGIRRWLPGLGLGLLLALAGVVPALALSWTADAETLAWANRAYVYHRLRHHLFFPAFPWWNRVSFLLLVLLGGAGYWVLERSPGWSLLGRVLVLALGLAAVGAALGLGASWNWDLAARWLRYYWFRPGDLWAPALTALVVVALLERAIRDQRRFAPLLLLGLLLAASVHLGHVVWQRHRRPWPRAEAHMTHDQFHDWVLLCRHLRQVVPEAEQAVFLTPRYTQTFHWYAQRAEVVNWKDVPQDAASLVRWWRRLVDVYDYRGLKGTGPWEQLAPEQLLRLARRYGATWAVVPKATGREYPFPVRYANASFVLYRLPTESAASQSPPNAPTRNTQ